MFVAADGAPFPPEAVARLQRDRWRATHAWKLLAGDWLVLDNLRVQHGRLPFVPDQARPRTVLTVYTE